MHRWKIAGRTLLIGPRPLVMGIVNVTPDSFSDGGQFATVEAAVEHARALIAEGADLLDIGGESTRPGAEPVPAAEELRRVVPVIEALAGNCPVPLSVDTSKAEVAAAAVAAGAAIINDVAGLADPAMSAVARDAGAGVILMHMQGTPQTMQQAPHYDDVIQDLLHFFESRLATLTSAGLEPDQVAIDPGIGFGKTSAHNATLLGRLGDFQRLGRPVCLGVSRKGFLGRIVGNRPVERRLAGSLAALLFAHSRQAVQIVRVHDVEETRDALVVFDTLEQAGQAGQAP